VRLRRPGAPTIESVRVNGKPWRHFDRTRELVRLRGLSGTVTVEARYPNARLEQILRNGRRDPRLHNAARSRNVTRE
jgi:hypothetical protein